MVVAGAERFFEMSFVLYQGVAWRFGSETKGYSNINEFNVLTSVLTTFDDF